MWDVIDAGVVCRQLGLAPIGMHTLTISHVITCNSLGAQAIGQARFGEGGGRIWLSNVTCSGTERVLMNCTTENVSSCTHEQDAGVQCPQGMIKPPLSILPFTDNCVNTM